MGTLTHQNPRAVGVQVVPQAVADQSHGLYLDKIRSVEEIRQAQALEGGADCHIHQYLSSGAVQGGDQVTH